MKIIGHRGAKGLAPENTLRSFEKALEHHVDEIEFDLRVTKDTVVIVHHNPDLTDPADNKLIVADHTFAELHKHKPDLLTFKELLETIDYNTHLLIEIKPHEPTEAIVQLIAIELTKGRPLNSMSVCSFDQAVLRAIHQALPEIELVVIERWSAIRARLRMRELNTKRVSMRSSWLWRGLLRAMHHQGYQISPYSMNDPRLVRKWQPYLYGVITDYPDRFEK
ncbi:MAG TPA: glycerophosphodiester phosphodiesterase [Candidatus Saccharimonadia bacterium]|nr:glycerophosphodiester phosphodiesterase [Candidatus Saccharimonadia bacterium]